MALSPYSFRVKVIDGAATEVVQDLVLEAAPSAYGRVPEFLLDNRFYNLVGRYLLDTVDRAKVELHFFRPFLAALGETFVHLDRDILCEAWGGSDESLRDVLDDLKVASDAAVKTIENIAPDALGNFDLVPGSGISFSPQPNGVMISTSSPANIIDILKNEAAVPPGGTVTLNLSTDEYLAQAWVKVNGVYYKTGNVPDTVGKHLSVDVNFSRSSPNTARMAMCVGSDGVRPVQHTVGLFSAAGLTISRYDALTVAHEETMVLSVNPTAPFYEPLVLSGLDTLGNPKVVVFWVELNANLDLMYAELDPANYTNAPIILSLTPLLAPATQVLPLPQDGAGNVSRLIGVIGSNGCAYLACLSDPGVPLQQIIVQVQVGSGPIPVVSYGVPVFGTPTTCLDMIYDNMRNALYWLVAAREFPAANGPLELYQVTGFPGLLAVAGPLLIDNTAPSGFDYRAAGLSMNAGDPAPANNHVGITVIRKASGPPDRENLAHWIVSGIGNPFPAGTWVTPQGSLGVVVVGPVYQSRFAKDWNINSTVESRTAFIEPQMNQDGFTVQRTYINYAGKLGTTERLMYFPRLKAWDNFPLVVDESYVWTRVAETQANVTNPTGYEGRVLVSVEDRHCYSSLDPSLKELITIDFDPILLVLTGRNGSPFTWDIMLAAFEEAGFPYPPNLMVACWQLAQGLRNYWIANSYYPSASCNPPGPGGVQGTVWDENEAGTTLTGGAVLYPTYYAVLPGTWDLDSGNTAQAEYYSVGAPGASNEFWAVFRYNSMPALILAAEAAISAVVGAAIPVTGVYNLVQLDAAMGSPGWPALYSGSPYDRYQFFCFVDAAQATYRLGWFSMNYIHDALVYGPAPTGGEFNIPFTENFTVVGDQTPNVTTSFTLLRVCRSADLYVNGILYLFGIDWGFGATMDIIEYYNRDPGGFVLMDGSVVSVKYYV